MISSLKSCDSSGGEGAYTDPYRLYNLDVFEYDPDSEMAIVRPSPPLRCSTLMSATVWIYPLHEGTPRWINRRSVPRHWI